MINMSEEKMIFVNFNSKLTSETFNKDAFIRIRNLDKEKPLIQVNDFLFQGKYDYALGTNLFFTKHAEASKNSDIFIKKESLKYEDQFKGNKVLNMESVKVPPPKMHFSKTTPTEFNLDWNYEELLNKFSNGTLDLYDMLKQTNVENLENEEKTNIEENKTDEMKSVSELINENIIETETTKEIPIEIDTGDVLDEIQDSSLLEAYNKLRQIAFRPMRSKRVFELCKSDPKYQEEYEYKNLEREVLKPCDFFREEPVENITEETLSSVVDIDRCILYGILKKSLETPRIFTKDEKKKVFCLNNFDNLSLVGRYYVLQNHVKDLEVFLENKNELELKIKDEYGRTPQQTLNLYRKLADAVRKRISEIKYSLKNDEAS